MTQILTTRDDKLAVIAEIERLLDRHLTIGLNHANRYLIREHLISLRKDPRDLKVNFRFETVPELESTRIHLEISFAGVPSFDDPAQKDI